MRIGIDARVLDRHITGTGRYLLNILDELPNLDKTNHYFLFTNSAYHFNEDFYKIIRYKQSTLPIKLYTPLWLSIKLPLLIKEHNIDILFTPNVIAPLVKLKKVKYVSVIHDAIYKIYKEYYSLSYRTYLSILLPRSINNSDVVVTVSEQSRKDIVKYYNVPEGKVKIVHNTAAKHFKPFSKSEINQDELLKKLELPQKYLLFVGAIEKRKNVLGVIKILDLVRDRGSDLQLVIVGKPDYDSHDILFEIEKRKEYIKFLHFVDDERLVSIYNNAFAFIFPSFYEGFGIPPLEAMQCGTPVLSSNTSALIEVVGNGGLLHNPSSYDEFAKDILRLESDLDFYSQMKAKAIEQSKKFNITKTTHDLIKIFNDLHD